MTERLTKNSAAKVASDAASDKIAEKLRGYVWDGVSRVDSFLTRYAGAPDTAEVRATSRRWLLSLVGRRLSPGCPQDFTLVLDGPQGCGKSRLLRELVGGLGRATYLKTSSLPTLAPVSADTWLVELSELEARSALEADRVKFFVTSRVDAHRPAYGSTVVSTPRRFVVTGTANSSGCLADLSGSRQYRVVRVSRVDVEAVRRDRAQILAEAFTCLR